MHCNEVEVTLLPVLPEAHDGFTIGLPFGCAILFVSKWVVAISDSEKPLDDNWALPVGTGGYTSRIQGLRDSLLSPPPLPS